MQIELNGDGLSVEEGVTVLRLMEQQGIGAETKGVAVAVNAEVVPRGRWGEVALAEGDKVDVIRAVAGG